MSGYAGISRRARKGDAPGNIALVVALWLAWRFVDVLIGAGLLIALVWVVVSPVYKAAKKRFS